MQFARDFGVILRVINTAPQGISAARIATLGLRIRQPMRTPWYTHTGLIAYMYELPTKGYVNMHEQVAKSLVYALAGGSTCMSVRLLGV